jgi:hypothetical protein
VVNLIKVGWLTHDIVAVEKTWCPICAKQRVHETYKGWQLCIICGQQTDLTPPTTEELQPGFQIERFIKGE